jgi:hypothetical protein
MRTRCRRAAAAPLATAAARQGEAESPHSRPSLARSGEEETHAAAVPWRRRESDIDGGRAAPIPKSCPFRTGRRRNAPS